ncbi:DUF2188 domain-containing protein [Candidatus Saccharibacteria bacterium]|nr:DUF2188 domain-containing protein [Candidatus Saccharibacteria bacterium]MBH1972750.1 DUF2188 domain-containing protein [Candidatus Saccharibacteria bacterium]MBH1990952.1 DUF2188 domain-containing protein [Candidatus Saccharibacteria bacterium]OGL23313.1 MAG: hypothetical protein A2791_00460 [Candidatus Saccharibacteria bacterium RIFCSPHIGHO2_01_FULL_46_30]
MAKNYTISGNKSKGYRATADGGKRASFTGSTQQQVIKQARDVMKQNGGGELRIQRTDRPQFRAADTVPPKKDNFPPRG